MLNVLKSYIDAKKNADASAEIARLNAEDNGKLRIELAESGARLSKLKTEFDRVFERAVAAEQSRDRFEKLLIEVQAENAALRGKVERMTSGLRQNRKPKLEMVA